VIDIFTDISAEKEIVLLQKVQERIGTFDKAYSRFRPDSLVTEISQKVGVYVLPDDAEKMMTLYRELFLLTKGLLTPLIGQVMVDSGYDAEYSLKQKRKLQRPPHWDEAIEYAHPSLTVKQPILLDFGAAGKGYLIDLVAEVILENNITDFCIDAGGDILSMRLMKIGLEDPEDFSKVIGVCNLVNKSLCASSGSRRKWSGLGQDFHHIINPDTLVSPRDILATWVVADTTLLSDALATSLFFVAPESLSQYLFEYVILYSDYSVALSDNFPGEIYIK
jgi:FAD:protein FMN transferase